MEREEIIYWLQADSSALTPLWERAQQVRQAMGEAVYLRGLIEYSNRCSKNCYYCGIRAANGQVERYTVDDQAVLQAAQTALDLNLGSLVLQGGECSSPAYTEHIEQLLLAIGKLSGGRLGITLSLGEQSVETYRRWRQAGAKRYLLRIESSDRGLYRKIHPEYHHDYDQRLACLDRLRSCDYQVGTGVMIGLPFQTESNLADDLLFFAQQDIDMVGMGPYIEHEQTPLWAYREQLWSRSKRLDLSLRMVALLRCLMPSINIAATTALQTLDPLGRERAVAIGANVIMPNLTPLEYREQYFLYDGKALVKDGIEHSLQQLERTLAHVGARICYGEHGDSQHYKLRQ